MRRLLTLLVAMLASVSMALAGTNSLMLIGAGAPIGSTASFNGPGSPGFLSTCSSTFQITNELPYSNTFSSWTAVASNSGNAPTVTTGITDPTGGTGASQVTIPNAISGFEAYSVIDVAGVQLAPYPTTFTVWAQMVSAPSAGTVWISISNSTNFASTAVPNDGAWHQVVVSVPISKFPNTTPAEQPQIGVNLSDSAEVANTGALKFNLYAASWIPNYLGPYVTSAMVTGSGALATTGTAKTANVSLPCPTMSNGTQIAYRDFSGMTPYSGNPVISENASEPWLSGGVSNPYIDQPIFFSGAYWGFTNASSSGCEHDWMQFGLFKSTDGLHWTEDTTNAPYLQAYGSTIGASCVVGTGLDSTWHLHPTFVPGGCTISGTLHSFCVLYGALQTNGTSYNTFLAWSDTIDGVYTPVGCTGPGNCAAPTPILPATPSGNDIPGGTFNPVNQNLPSIVNVGGVNYIYTINGNGNGTYITAWQQSGSLTGARPTWAGTTYPGPLTTDWDAGAVTVDPMVIKNACGFYEMFYTAYKSGGFGGNSQAIGYAISNSPLGPWWKYETSSIIPYTSSLYNGTPYLGDSSPVSIGGQFIWLGNWDDGSTHSRAVAATMPDHCP